MGAPSAARVHWPDQVARVARPQTAPVRSRPTTTKPAPTARPKPKANEPFCSGGAGSAKQPSTASSRQDAGDRRGITLAEGRALKPTLWFPGVGASMLTERDLEEARRLTSRNLGMDVEMRIVRCTRFGGVGALTLCAVCTPNHIIGCYQLTDGLGGIMFRRMTDAVCRELIGTLGPFPTTAGRYEPLSTNTFNGSRVFPSGVSIDSIATYQNRNIDPAYLV